MPSAGYLSPIRPVIQHSDDRPGICPLTSAWHDLLEVGLEDDTSMMVPASHESVGDRSESLVPNGNASKFISQARRSKLLEAIEPSWSKYATDSHVVNDTLFGKDIQASLTSTIEADSALFKAVSIVKWSQKGKEPLGSSIRIDGQASTCFLRGAPARYGALLPDTGLARRDFSICTHPNISTT